MEVSPMGKIEESVKRELKRGSQQKAFKARYTAYLKALDSQLGIIDRFLSKYIRVGDDKVSIPKSKIPSNIKKPIRNIIESTEEILMFNKTGLGEIYKEIHQIIQNHYKTTLGLIDDLFKKNHRQPFDLNTYYFSYKGGNETYRIKPNKEVLIIPQSSMVNTIEKDCPDLYRELSFLVNILFCLKTGHVYVQWRYPKWKFIWDNKVSERSAIPVSKNPKYNKESYHEALTQKLDKLGSRMLNYRKYFEHFNESFNNGPKDKEEKVMIQLSKDIFKIAKIDPLITELQQMIEQSFDSLNRQDAYQVNKELMQKNRNRIYVRYKDKIHKRYEEEALEICSLLFNKLFYVYKGVSPGFAGQWFVGLGIVTFNISGRSVSGLLDDSDGREAPRRIKGRLSVDGDKMEGEIAFPEKKFLFTSTLAKSGIFFSGELRGMDNSDTYSWLWQGTKRGKWDTPSMLPF